MIKRVFQIIIIFLSISSAVSAEELIRSDKALQKAYPQATAFDKKEISLTPEQLGNIESSASISFDQGHSSQLIVYIVRMQDATIGYAFEDIVIGKWGPIHYLVALDINGKIMEVIVLDYKEIRGRPIAKKRFLKQYAGKTISNPLKLRKDINGITGASISSRSLTDGVRKLLYVFSQIKSDLH